ncbi:MAG: tail protein X [Alphaproteobacteria bacterium]
MADTITTTDGDMIDLIAWNHYGFHEGTVEAILEANPDLAGQPPVLAGGVEIVLPVIDKSSVETTVKLYD